MLFLFIVIADHLISISSDSLLSHEILCLLYFSIQGLLLPPEQPTCSGIFKDSVMLFHDRGTVNIADVVRYIVTYDPSLDPINKHKILSHITSADHAPSLFHPKLHLRIRNNASILLRAAYLQGPYALAISAREDTFHANDETVKTSSTSAPIYDHDLKASTSFWAELASEKK